MTSINRIGETWIEQGTLTGKLRMGWKTRMTVWAWTKEMIRTWVSRVKVLKEMGPEEFV